MDFQTESFVSLNLKDTEKVNTEYYHPSLRLYLLAGSISKTRIKVRVS